MNRFIISFFVGYFLIMTMVVVFNIFVDPYALMSFSLIPRTHKGDTSTHMRLTKAIDIIRQKPRAILLGSSRVLIGCSQADLEASVGMPSYNLALSGACFEEIFAYFQHALHHQKDLKVVVLGVDLFAFNENRSCSPDFDATLLANNCFPWQCYWKALGTIQGVRASLKTLYSLYSYTPHTYIDDKGNLPMRALLECKDPSESFEEFEQRALRGNFFNHDVYGDFCLSQKAIELFHRMAAICKERDIVLQVFFSPCRALYWHGIYLKELWIDLEYLKRELVKSVPIWDTSGCNVLSQEAVAEYPSSSFLDQSHFHLDIGKEILETLLLNQKMRFGILLNQENCEDYLNFLREEQVKWPLRHPQEAAFLKRAFDSFSLVHIKTHVGK